MEEKDGKGQSYQYRMGGRAKRRTVWLEYKLTTGTGSENSGILLTGDWRHWEGYSTLKSHENMVENHWELCGMISHVVKRLRCIGH